MVNYWCNFDVNGFLLTRVDRNGVVFRYSYDNMVRVVRVEAVENGVVVEFREILIEREKDFILL